MPDHALSRRGLLRAAGLTGLAGAGLTALGPPAHARPKTPRLGTIALVPLDDRPYTWYAPQQIATGAGYDTLLPPRETLGRHFAPGDGRAVGQWLTSSTTQADALVVALPMLAYGGLLNSRNSSVPEAEAFARLAAVRTVRQRRPHRRLYAFDTIMRLTPEGPWRNELRAWATVKDEVDNLGMVEKRPQLDALESQIPADVRDDYLATRARNHRINLTMIEWAAEGIFDFLVVGQDDATGHGLHRPESQALAARIAELGVGDRVVIYPGADVVAALLIAKIAVRDADVRPRVSVEYSRVPGEEWTAPYQNIPYAQLVKGYVDILGGTVVDRPEQADLVLMANTGGSSASVAPFADRLVAHVRAGRLVALGDDAIAGHSDRRLLSLLHGRIRYVELAGYSGWNIGISLAQATSRWALRQRSLRGDLPPGAPRTVGEPVLAARRALLHDAARATIELSISELVQTDSYRASNVRTATTAYASALGEPDPQNIATHFAEINAYAVDNTVPHAEKLFADEFAGATLALGSDGRAPVTARVDRLDAWHLYLPWNRTGEIAAEPRIVLTPDRGRR
ncbi:DUF4127 family protein [Micromonospora sp. AMSO12t]|uniref:DUF4127 family protein n=1 Tax=Micromonospora sp. AMSO12t TaxID=2650410 RepID=UPI001788DB62|nr:DUF4127 family protein [Micromonospora sp. AMSO12t]